MVAVLARVRLLVVAAAAARRARTGRLWLRLLGRHRGGRDHDGRHHADDDNDFIPADQNLTDCVGTLEKPDCGSNRKDDLNMYLTFGVLMGGMALIGWRIAVAVRQRDRAQEEHLPEHTY